MDAAAVGAVVLAAGAGSRFRAADPEAGPKLLARLEGVPVLQHVLDGLADLAFGVTLVVLGSDGDEIEAAISWRDERRVRNPAPGEGLSSTVRIGLNALESASDQERDAITGALMVLGDQPRVSVDVVRRLLAVADEAPDRPLIVPRYRAGGAINPVLLRRSAWSLATELRGDRGFGPLIASRPELVVWVPVEGDILDIDTPADLQSVSTVPAGSPGDPRPPG